MRIDMWHFSHRYSFPTERQPDWSGRVDRWYQLDAAAYGLAETYHSVARELPSPNFIFLASPGASNDTDYDFVRTGVRSPNKFVHTLPNVRSLPLLQVMDWKGPVLCCQKDPQTFVAGLEEALVLLGPSSPVGWVMGVFREPSSERTGVGKFFSVHILVVSNSARGSGAPYLVEAVSEHSNGATDLNFLKWLTEKPTADRAGAFRLPTDLVSRTSKL